MTTRISTTTEVHDALTADHREIEALLETLRACAAADESCDLDAAWGAFENAMLAHLDKEEMLVLPVFDRCAPVDAARFRADHARLRSRMGELGVMIELHTVRQGQVDEFAEQLREHASREEATMYRWADEGMPVASRPSLLRRLGRVVERARGGAPRAEGAAGASARREDLASNVASGR